MYIRNFVTLIAATRFPSCYRQFLHEKEADSNPKIFYLMQVEREYWDILLLSLAMKWSGGADIEIIYNLDPLSSPNITFESCRVPQSA